MAWRACPGGNCGAHFLKQALRVPGATIAGSPLGRVTTLPCLLGVVVVAWVCVLEFLAVVAVVPLPVAPTGAVTVGIDAEAALLFPLSEPPQAASVRADSAAAIASPMRISPI